MATIFLDRDGVINENRSDYVKNWNEFRFLPGARESIAKLTYAGFHIVVCTNQAGIARGNMSIEVVEEIHNRMVTEVESFGGRIEKVYYCPHSKDDNCSCRKPRPGMILRAHDELNINLSTSIFIGDSMSDIHAGLAANVRSVLVLTGRGKEQLFNHCKEANGQFLVFGSLSEVTEAILQGTIGKHLNYGKAYIPSLLRDNDCGSPPH